jgi:glycosyltransferase involved in cell wall biosynthesis
MKSNIGISVIMPVYNQNINYLKKAIDSILNQTFTNFEFIIIDDGSNNKDCINILDQYSKIDQRVKLIRNLTNIGLTKSLNKALGTVRGLYIARMDSDDISKNNRFEVQFNYLEKNKDCMLCGSWVNLINEDEKIIGKTKPETKYDKIKKILIKGNIFTHSAWFFRKNLIEKIGYYSEIAEKNEDYDFLLRTASQYEISNIPEYLCDYRINMKSISFSHNKTQELNALRTRVRAIENYGYSKKNYLYLIKPLLIFIFIPFTIKKYLYRFIWKK